MKWMCCTHETCFPLNPPTKVEYTGFGYGSAFLVDDLSPLIQSSTSNFVCEILIVRIPIATPSWCRHSDAISTSLPLSILTTLLWLCPYTIKYDSENFPYP